MRRIRQESVDDNKRIEFDYNKNNAIDMDMNWDIIPVFYFGGSESSLRQK